MQQHQAPCLDLMLDVEIFKFFIAAMLPAHVMFSWSSYLGLLDLIILAIPMLTSQFAAAYLHWRGCPNDIWVAFTFKPIQWLIHNGLLFRLHPSPDFKNINNPNPPLPPPRRKKTTQNTFLDLYNIYIYIII